jgi:N4-gp56 family major capsid protein
MTATIPSSSALAKTKWANDVLEGHLRQNPLSPIMRPVGNNSIIVTDKVNAGDGTTKRFQFVDEMSLDSWRSGDQNVSGTGEALRFGTDDVTVTRQRAAIQVNNLTESALRTAVGLPETAKTRLQRAAASKVAYGILAALCDVTQGRTANRYLYGSSESNYNATHATALANVDETDDQVTTDMLDLVLYKAQNQTSGKTFITPATVTAKDGTTAEKFIVLLHPRAAFNFKKTAGYKNLVNYKDKPVFNVINGGFFVGEYNNMLIYERPAFVAFTSANPDPMLATAAGANGINVAHNLLLGANAAALRYGSVELFDDPSLKPMKTSVDTDGGVRMAITTEVGDHGGNAEMAVTMVPGYKQLVDNSGGTAECVGVVHFFSAAN